MAGKNINAFLLEPTKARFKDEEKENGLDVKDEYLLKIISEIYSKDNVEVKTDINAKQINAITKGLLFAERYKCNIMKSLCNNIMTLSISKDRKSRKEFTEISKSISTPYEEESEPTLRKRLIGE